MRTHKRTFHSNQTHEYTHTHTRMTTPKREPNPYTHHVSSLQTRLMRHSSMLGRHVRYENLQWAWQMLRWKMLLWCPLQRQWLRSGPRLILQSAFLLLVFLPHFSSSSSLCFLTLFFWWVIREWVSESAAVIYYTTTDPCAAVRCGRHGRCFDGTCFCEDSYTGENCQIAPGIVVVHGRE